MNKLLATLIIFISLSSSVFASSDSLIPTTINVSRKPTSITVSLSLPSSVFSNNDSRSTNSQISPINTNQISVINTSQKSTSYLYMGAYGGYGDVSGAYHNDGQVAQGRLVLGVHALRYKSSVFGAEFGLESGNDMRLEADASMVESAGGLPIQSTLKPLIDMLITIKSYLPTHYPLLGILKGGLAYRQLQLEDRSSARDGLRKVNPELQVGFGLDITEHAMLTAFYQGIYSGSNAEAAVNSLGDVTISRIPTQQAIFIGLEYSL